MLKAFSVLMITTLLGLVSQASVADSANCSSSVAGLEQLAKSARFLPDGMSEAIYGVWYGNRLLAEATLRIRQENGKVLLFVHAKSSLAGIDQQDEGVATFCFTNQPEITVHVRLFGKDEAVKLKVNSLNSIQVLEGQLRGLFRKQS